MAGMDEKLSDVRRAVEPVERLEHVERELEAHSEIYYTKNIAPLFLPLKMLTF